MHVHLVAAVPNGLTVEYMPWSFSALQGGAAAGRRGELVVPQKPGLGLEFDEKNFKRYAA